MVQPKELKLPSTVHSKEVIKHLKFEEIFFLFWFLVFHTNFWFVRILKTVRLTFKALSTLRNWNCLIKCFAFWKQRERSGPLQLRASLTSPLGKRLAIGFQRVAKTVWHDWKGFVTVWAFLNSRPARATNCSTGPRPPYWKPIASTCDLPRWSFIRFLTPKLGAMIFSFSLNRSKSSVAILVR